VVLAVLPVAACDQVFGLHKTILLSPDGGPDPLLECPASYAIAPVTGTAYESSQDSGVAAMTFVQAEQRCVADQPASTKVHTHLVVLSSPQELDYLVQIRGAYVNWVGLSDLASTGTYQWVTDEPVDVLAQYWASGEPNNPTTEPCAYIGQDNQFRGKLDTIPCDQTPRDFTCECDLYQDNPARY
jgi:hypothetical protein